MTELETPKRPIIPNWLKTPLAMMVSGFILYYYFADQDWKKLYEAMAQANIILAILALLIPQLLIYFCDVFITTRHFQWFHGPFPWKEFCWVRGAMYLILLVNSTIGGGGIVLYLQRKTQITWTKFIGLMIFRTSLTMWSIAILLIPVTLAMHYYNIFEVSKLNPYIWWTLLSLGLIGFIEGWFAFHYNKPFLLTRLILNRIENEIWTAFRIASKAQWLLTILWGLIPMIAMLGGFWFLALAFGVKIPILHFAATSLVVMMIMDLPIAFAGFGTTTMAWMIFYSDYGSQEAIASLTLFLPFARAAIRAIIGLVALKPAINDINMLLQASKAKQENKKRTANSENIQY